MALLFEKDFTTLTITEVVSKIRSLEMFMMEDMEASTSHSSANADICYEKHIVEFVEGYLRHDANADSKVT
jgi:hypothetical protein